MGKWINKQDHAQDIGDGRMIGPGEEADLSAEEERDEHNQALIEDGILVSANQHSSEGPTTVDPEEGE